MSCSIFCTLEAIRHCLLTISSEFPHFRHTPQRFVIICLRPFASVLCCYLVFLLVLQIWRDTDSGAQEPVTIWRPRAPSGYVALGCVAVPDYYEPDRSIVRCVRQECTTPARLGEEPTWRDHKGAALWQCSLWQVDNQARTFLARRDHQRPNEEAALAVRTMEVLQA